MNLEQDFQPLKIKTVHIKNQENTATFILQKEYTNYIRNVSPEYLKVAIIPCQ